MDRCGDARNGPHADHSSGNSQALHSKEVCVLEGEEDSGAGLGAGGDGGNVTTPQVHQAPAMPGWGSVGNRTSGSKAVFGENGPLTLVHRIRV